MDSQPWPRMVRRHTNNWCRSAFVTYPLEQCLFNCPGLGDPKDKTKSPAFATSGYSGTYDTNIVGDPVLSDDKMSVTLRFKQKIANWDQYGPGPSPVHALVLMSEGKKELQSASENLRQKLDSSKRLKIRIQKFSRRLPMFGLRITTLQMLIQKPIHFYLSAMADT